MRAATIALLLLSPASLLLAQSEIAKKVLSVGAARGEQLIQAGDIETHENGTVDGADPWALGYVVDDEVFRGGQFSARCTNETAEEHRGLTFEIVLNQTEPVPIIAECWSKAESVSGGRDPNYSLYLDLEYMDGTPLWGQLAPFKPGTHDWLKRSVTVVPEKPIKSVQVHGIFRMRSGTAWFDDFKLWELELPEGAQQFDGVAITETRPIAASLPGGWQLCLRDVAVGSDFVAPEFERTEPDDQGSFRVDGTDDALQLAVSATFRDIGNALRIDGTVRDLSGKDRAVAVYLIKRVDAIGGQWHDDQRVSRPIKPEGRYSNFVPVSVGTNGLASRYPLACVSGPRETHVIGTPLDVPRICRFGYEAGSRELYAAVDLGLTSITHKFPSQAGFSFVAYQADREWGFRAALKRYYELFPQLFTKRNEREGIWMPFTDIETVDGFGDFYFQFQEGAPNVAFDEAHGIYSFVYVEPMSNWVAMPPEMERTNARAIKLVTELAEKGQRQAQATFSSVVHTDDGSWSGGIVKAPWCDGAVFHLNPSPNVKPEREGDITQWDHEWGTVEGRFKNPSPQMVGWRAWGGGGFEVAPGEGRNGSDAIKLSRKGIQPTRGAVQTVTLKQDEARPIIARVWTRAEGVSGDVDADYSLYIDLVYTDGTNGFGFVVGGESGTHDWQLLEQTIVPAKPVRMLLFHCLFRAPREGMVWFDDALLAEQGSDKNLLESAAFEPDTSDRRVPELDGTYIDSLEMAATERNYRREHMAEADIPLVFDMDRRLCQLMIFNTVEFTRETALRMWQRGKLMFANSTPVRFSWAAPYLDVMGIETNWAPGGEYQPNPDSIMNWRRALCYQRPYLLLLNTVYDDFEPEWVELYFKRCAAYGIFPSFFSHNAADDPYWRRPNLYNRDRPLFKRWLPVIKSLNAAGWEPVTYARSDNPKIYVERFGSPGGPLYLTLFNDSREARSARISVDTEALALGTVPDQLVGDITLQPEDVVVVQLAE